MAEIINYMLLETRTQQSLLSSLLSTVAFLHSRRVFLHGVIQKALKESPGKGTTTPWTVPAVGIAAHKARADASRLVAPPRQARRDGANIYYVHLNEGATAGDGSGSEHLCTVNLQAYIEGDYAGSCTCGENSTRGAPHCRHVARVLLGLKKDWRDYVKPWQSPRAWVAQVGPDWTPVSAAEMEEAAQAMVLEGGMRALVQPRIEIGGRGRPKKRKAVSTPNSERAKSFMEEMRSTQSREHVSRILAGLEGNVSRQGGRGTKKTCRYCRCVDQRMLACLCAPSVLYAKPSQDCRGEGLLSQNISLPTQERRRSHG